MDYIIINNKKYDIKKFDTGGYNEGYINFTKNKLGKILLLSEYRKINKKLDTENYSENPYREIEIHKECNKIIKNNLTSNLVKFYSYHIYNNYIILIIEKYDGNLNSIIDTLSLDQLWSIFFQIFITFVILQDNLGFYQGDFGLTNILYKNINNNKKFLYYTYNGIKYKIPNYGYKIAISDYGNAIINKFILANYEKDYYYINLKKRIELYEILLLLVKYIKKKTLNDNYQKKLIIINNIIYNNVRFNLYNGIYTINPEFTEIPNHDIILKNLYNEFVIF